FVRDAAHSALPDQACDFRSFCRHGRGISFAPYGRINPREDRMRNLAKVKRKKSKGFTLIELLVVVAIPQFAAYRQRGYRSQLVADVRNAATGEEAYFVDFQTYGSTCTALPGFT